MAVLAASRDGATTVQELAHPATDCSFGTYARKKMRSTDQQVSVTWGCPLMVDT
jgi:hypothetical protein